MITVEKQFEVLRGVLQDAQRRLEDALHRLDELEVRVGPKMFGAKGGRKTAERGSQYFRELAAKRKVRSGGRPKKVMTSMSRYRQLIEGGGCEL